MRPRRFVWTLACAIAVAVVTTIMVAISEIYLSGHGMPGVTNARFIDAAFGVHLSLGDVILLSSTVLGGALAWWTYDKA